VQEVVYNHRSNNITCKVLIEVFDKAITQELLNRMTDKKE